MARPRQNQTNNQNGQTVPAGQAAQNGQAGQNGQNGQAGQFGQIGQTQAAAQARPTRANRAVYGPQSALTDFLASHNISANQIRTDAEARRRQAATSDNAQNGDENEDDESSSAPLSTSTRRRSARNAPEDPSTKRKREEEKKIQKIKESKAFKRRKKRADASDDDELARAIFEQTSAPLPGQMENCEICKKRFTVTPYSVAGPNGGLLCAPCGRKVAKERQDLPKKKPKKPTGAGGVGRRRAIQSRILDGDFGTKSLATLCVQTLAKNVDLADSLGDLPDHLIDKIARMFSKRRLLKPETLPLFVQPNTESVHIYDGARLGEQDYIGIFQVAQQLRHLKIRCGIQFKDDVMDYLLSRGIALESFYLHGANLLSEDKWHEFLRAKGETLKALQVYYTDKHFGDDTMVVLKENCPKLKRLKIENNQKLTDVGVKSIGEISTLEHIGLQLQNKTHTSAYKELVSKIGANLRTLSLKVVPGVDDGLLRAIHQHCRSLIKLRITDSEEMTDFGFAELFTGWANPPLNYVDFQKCRQLDASQPRENPDKLGLCSDGFKALMAHSGQKLQYLNVHACRHITREAFEEVFHQDAHYPELKELEISFCEEVTDFILGSIFRACPNIREVNVFGCMKVKSVRVPRGVILVGVPNAQGMIVEGTDD